MRKLAALEPLLVVTGHGRPLRGEGMLEALRQLARDFDEIAVPKLTPSAPVTAKE